MNRTKIVFFLFFISNQVFSQNDTTIVMEELVLNGNRISIPFSEASRNIQIISRDEIRKAPIQSIPEILTYSPGVDIRQRGPMGVQSDIGIRGGTFEQTLILLNGVKLTDPQTGHHVMNIPIPMDNIYQVEVLKGPGARKYGQNAFSGAVNFITKAHDIKKIGVRAYGGSFASYGGNVSFSMPISNYKQVLSLSRDASEGYQHNTDYGINNIFYQSEFQARNGKYELIFGLTDRKFGANGFYASPDYTEQYEEVRTSMTSLSYESETNDLKIKPRIYWRANQDKYLFVREKPEIYQNQHKTNTFGAEVNASYKSYLGITGIGIEFRKETIIGDWIRGGIETKSNLNGFGRNNFGVYLDQKFKIGNRFDLTPGVYVNWYSDFGWNAFPGIDMGFIINDKIRLYGNAGKSYRIPTFYDQYYKSPFEQGNPNLKPEEAITYEIGLRYIHGGFSFEGNYFVRNASQLIDWVYHPVDSIWRSQNFQNTTTNGFEISINFSFDKMMDANFPIYNIGISYNYLDQNIDETEGIQSRYVLEQIRNQVILGIDHKIAGKLKNNFKARLIDRIEQDSYILIDDRIYYEQNEKFTIFLEAVNLTNQVYTEVMTQMPGRWIRGGINFDIGF